MFTTQCNNKQESSTNDGLLCKGLQVPAFPGHPGSTSGHVVLSCEKLNQELMMISGNQPFWQCQLLHVQQPQPGPTGRRGHPCFPWRPGHYEAWTTNHNSLSLILQGNEAAALVLIRLLVEGLLGCALNVYPTQAPLRLVSVSPASL